jgi:hypothetical protein
MRSWSRSTSKFANADRPPDAKYWPVYRPRLAPTSTTASPRLTSAWLPWRRLIVQVTWR